MQDDEPSENPRISVLMAVFNTGAFLREALNSVAAQSFRDFELIAIDDGSTDASTQILEQFATMEPRMRLIVRPNRGLIATRNELLTLAKAPLIAWMDSDDVSLPERLEIQAARFAVDPELVCLGTSVQCVDPGGHPLGVETFPSSHGDILVEQKKGGAMRFPTTMMRRSAALRVGRFREPFKMGEDFDFLLRLSESGKMANLPIVAYLYRQHLASTVTKLVFDWAAYRDQILALAREREEFGRDRLDMGVPISIGPTNGGGGNPHRVAVSAYVEWSRYAVRNGNRSLALQYARSALRAGPIALLAWTNMAHVLLNVRSR